MRIIRKVDSCRVSTATADELAWLQEYLSIPTVAFAGGRPRPTVRRYFNASRKAFPPGLLRLVQKKALERGFVIDVIDERERPAGDFKIPKFRTLVPAYYQVEAAKKAHAAEVSSVEIGTGGGKSFLATIIFAAWRGRCIYVVSTEQLAEQAASEFERETGERAGRCYGGRLEVGERVVFATFGTLHKRIVKAKPGFRHPDGSPAYVRDDAWIEAHLSDFTWLVVDEVHEVPAATFETVALAIPAFFRTGLSATPFSRGDGKAMSVIATTGPLCYKKTQRELADEGFTAMGTVYMVRYPQSVFIGPWQRAYTYQIVRDEERNALVAAIAAHARKPCLVLFNDVEHGATLLRALRGRGIEAVRIDGRIPVASRRELARKLNDGEIDVILASKVFRTGVNIKALRTVVRAAGRKSEIEVVQGTGRATRMDKDSGKATYDVYDVLDVADDGRSGKGRWMADHAKRRLRTYRKQGYDVRVGDGPRGPWTIHPALDASAKDEEE